MQHSKIVSFLLSCLPLCFAAYSVAQNAPITTLATVGNAVPGQVSVPVTVTNFNNIGAISLSLTYNYAGLHIINGVPNPLLGNFAIGDTDLGNGIHRINMGWFGGGVSLPNGSTIMTLNFTYLSGNTALEWYETGPSCEYADASLNVLNDIPTSTYYINGYVCGIVGNPGTIAGSTSVCRGVSGISYSIAPMTNVSGYNWTVPPGAVIISGNNTNAITVDFPASASSGNVTAKGFNDCGSGPVSTLPVTVNLLPVANAGSNITIPYGTSTTLHAAYGGTGTFSYQWTPANLLVNPNIQDPTTVNLVLTTQFTVHVTNLATLCLDSDEVVVSISGGPLNVNPFSFPSQVCKGETAQLLSNPGGGSGNYTYSWSATPPGTPPWSSNVANPVVAPDVTTVYQVSVNDGFNTANGSTTLQVNTLPTATISGGDTLCGPGQTTTLTVALTGTPPWSFTYSDGLSTYTVNGQTTTPYAIITSTPGTYTVLAVNDANCYGTANGAAVVILFPIPGTPVISASTTQLFSSFCCGNQWHKNGVPIAGATSQSYTPAESANYFDIITLNGCVSDTSNSIYFLMVGTDDHDKSSFSVEPNPASGFVRIRSGGNFSQVADLRLYDLSGILVREKTFNPVDAGNTCTIDLHGLAPALYILRISTGGWMGMKKVVVY